MKLNFKQTLPVLVSAGITVFSTSASAGFSNEQLLSVLLGNGAITQQQHDELLGMTKDEEKKAEDMSANDIKVTLNNGSLKLKNKDESFKMQIGGRIMVDAASFDDGGNQYDDGTELRRARLFVKGTVWRDWHYKAQYDFAGDAVHIKDAWIKYTGFNDMLEFPLEVTFGNFKEVFSMEALTSSKYITFMERSMATEVFAPGRNIGLGFNTYGQVMDGGWSAAMGYFGHGIDDDDDGDESYGYVGRATFAPIASKTRVLHVGGAVEHRKWKGRNYRLRARPETHIGNTRIVDTGLGAVDDVTTWNFDTAAVYGPFSVQGEYFHQNVDSVAEGDLDFDGWYAYASYFLTGESRVYDVKHGLFKRTKPNSIVGKGGYGAWEVAARYSAINLNDGAIKGGRAQNMTIGVNWYATPSIRFMGNYVMTDASRSDKEDPNIFQLRGQIDF